MAKHAAPKASKSDAVRKFRTHCIFIGFAAVFSIGSTFIGVGIFAHIVVSLPAFIPFGQEFVDMIRGW